MKPPPDRGVDEYKSAHDEPPDGGIEPTGPPLDENDAQVDGSELKAVAEPGDPPRGPRETEAPEARELPDAVGRALREFDQRRWVVEASFTPEAQAAFLDAGEQVEVLRLRVDSLIDRLADVPLIPDRARLIRRLREGSDSDIGRCLLEISQALETVTPLTAPVKCPPDPATFIELLEQAIRDAVKDGKPSIVVLPAPDGRLAGTLPSRPVTDVEVRDSKAVMFGADATLTVIHRCEVTRPVIEIADLVDHTDDGPSWGWWTVQPPRGPVVAGAATGLRSRIVSCSGVSIGDHNGQNTIIEHRMTSCPVDRAMLLSDPTVAAQLVRCRDDSLDPVERREAREQLRRVLVRFVRLADTSALIPDEVIASSASSAAPLPTVRSRGAALTVVHGMGVAVGRRPTVTGETRTRVGHFQIR